jgi:hypothetical protein
MPIRDDGDHPPLVVVRFLVKCRPKVPEVQWVATPMVQAMINPEMRVEMWVVIQHQQTVITLPCHTFLSFLRRVRVVVGRRAALWRAAAARHWELA